MTLDTRQFADRLSRSARYNLTIPRTRPNSVRRKPHANLARAVAVSSVAQDIPQTAVQ